MSVLISDRNETQHQIQQPMSSVDTLKQTLQQCQNDRLACEMEIKSLLSGSQTHQPTLSQTFGSPTRHPSHGSPTHQPSHVNHHPTSVSSTESNDSVLEAEVLHRLSHKLPFKKYLEMGFAKYTYWLGSIIGSSFTSQLRFCIARELNLKSSNAMGVDLEVKYIMKRLESLFGQQSMQHYESIIKKTLKENLGLSDSYIQITLDEYYKSPSHFNMSLSEDEFVHRLKNVPTEILDSVSQQSWRNSNYGQLNSTPYKILANDIRHGEAMNPPSTHHIGNQMFYLNGFISHKPISHTSSISLI